MYLNRLGHILEFKLCIFWLPELRERYGVVELHYLHALIAIFQMKYAKI